MRQEPTITAVAKIRSSVNLYDTKKAIAGANSRILGSIGSLNCKTNLD